jgi:hypothetical protein
MAGLRCPSHGRLRQSHYQNRPSAEGRSKWLTLLRKKLSFSIPNRFIPALPDPFDGSSAPQDHLYVGNRNRNDEVVLFAAFAFAALHCAFGYFATFVAHVGDLLTGLICGTLGILVVLATYRTSRSRGTAFRLFAMLLTSALALVANAFLAEWLFLL